VSLSKLILTVSVIVCIGALFGAVGYLASNNHQINPPIIITPTPSDGKITVSIDKTEYEWGEEIKIDIKNNVSADVEIYWPYFEVEKKENDQWKRIITNLCACSNIECNIDINGFEILKKGKAKSEKWNQKIANCDGSEEIENYYFEASAGIYRIVAKTRITTHGHFSLDYFNSPEFTIKEKSAVDPRCGQKVKFDSKCARANEVYGYEFDTQTNKCIKVNAGGGCSLETPFGSLEECQKVCEK